MRIPTKIPAEITPAEIKIQEDCGGGDSGTAVGSGVANVDSGGVVGSGVADTGG